MKLFLRFQNGSLAGRTFELSKGFLTVGRDQSCDVGFDARAETIASKKHAFLELKPDGFYLVDNQSTNGTFLNGRKIQSARINSGDTIQFGRNGIQATVFIESNAHINQPPQQRQQVSQQANFQPAQFNQSSQMPVANLLNTMSNLGLGQVREGAKPSETGKFVGAAIAIFSAVFLSLIVMLIVVADVGFGAAFVASIVAFLPAVFYLMPLVWLDRYDPEPLWLLASAFAWGALVAVIVSFVVNTVIGAIFGEAIGAVVSAPVFEEGSKGLGLILLLIFFRRYFDDILDGIIFAGTIALGFATVENVIYYGRGILEGGSQSLILLFFLRGILSPFAHVTFTSMTGIGCGIARESYNKLVRISLPILGYGCAVMLHGIWNTMATVGGLGGFILGYVVLEVPFS